MLQNRIHKLDTLIKQKVIAILSSLHGLDTIIIMLNIGAIS